MPIVTWIQNNNPESIAIVLSTISIIITLLFSRKEKPNIMPTDSGVVADNHLNLVFLNTSDFTIHNLTILINGFDCDLNESKIIDFSDKYLFSIGEKSTFNYGLNINHDVTKIFYFRVRLKGFYNTRIPFIKRKTVHNLWYSVIPLANPVDNKIYIKIANTHRDEIDKIEAKYAGALKNYDQKIDKEYR